MTKIFAFILTMLVGILALLIGSVANAVILQVGWWGFGLEEVLSYDLPWSVAFFGGYIISCIRTAPK